MLAVINREHSVPWLHADLSTKKIETRLNKLLVTEYLYVMLEKKLKIWLNTSVLKKSLQIGLRAWAEPVLLKDVHVPFSEQLTILTKDE